MMLELPENTQCDAAEFKKAMRRLTSAVSIVATQDGSARFGMVATAVSSVCAEPPAVLVCVHRASAFFAPLIRRQQFSLNVLREDQHELISIFGGALRGPARFHHGEWGEAGELPYLTDAQATLFCRVDGRLGYGSHEIVVGRVEATLVADLIAPLLWQDGRPAASRIL